MRSLLILRLGPSAADGGSARTQLGFASQPLMPVGGIFEPVLRGASLERQEAHDRVATAARPVDAGIGKEFDRLADAVPVL